MSGTGIGVIITGVNVRAMMIAADRKTMLGVIEARRAKRKLVLHELSLLGLDIVLLQETNVSNKTQADEISKGWIGHCFWSFGTRKKSRVAYLFPCTFKEKFRNLYLILMVEFLVP